MTRRTQPATAYGRALRDAALPTLGTGANAYAVARENGSTALQALRAAKYVNKWADSPLLELATYGNKGVTLELGGGLVAVCKLEPDNDADLSWLGEFSNKRESTNSIDHHKATHGSSRDYRWFNPGNDYTGDGTTREEARRYVMEDYRRVLDYGNGWSTFGVVVSIHHEDAPDVELAQGSVWGIESDSEPEHFAEVATDIIGETIREVPKKAAEIVAALAPKTPKVDHAKYLRPYGQPGKYEGGPLINSLVDNSDWFAESTGDTETTGHYALIRGPFSEDDCLSPEADEIGLTWHEAKFLMSIAGAIVYTDSQGFVDVMYSEDASELEARWAEVERITEAASEEDE